MKSLLTFLVLIHGYALADELNPKHYQSPMATLSAINNGTLLSAPAVDCNSYSEVVKKNNKELFNRCAVDLCGPPEKNVSHFISDDKFYKSAGLWNKLKVKINEPLLKALFVKAKNYQLAELEALKNYLKNPNFENLSNEGQVSLAAEVFSPYVKIKAHPKMAKVEDRIELVVTPPAKASSDLIEAINHYSANLKMSVTSNPLNFIKHDVYSDEELGELAKKMINDLLKDLENYKGDKKNTETLKNKLQVMHSNFDFRIPPRIHLENELLELKDLSNSAFYVTNNDVLGQAKCSTPACLNSYKQFVENATDKTKLEENITRFEQILKSPDTEKNAINRCKANIIFKETKRVNEQKAKEVFAQAKHNVEKNLLPRFSKHSRKILQDYLDNQLSVNSNKTMVNEKVGDFASRAKLYLALNKKVPTDSLRLLKLSRQLNDSFDEIDPLAAMYPCESKIPTITDLFLSVKSEDPALKKAFKKYGGVDQIFTSDFTCQHGDHGIHLMAHEIAHGISNFLATNKISESSKATYDKARSCVTSNYIATEANSPKSPIQHPGDASHSEEDMADFLAALSNPDDKKIVFCSLLESSTMNNSYIHLSFIEPNTIHSSGLTRALFEAVNKGITFPPTCQELIAEENPGVRFQKCEL